MSINDSYAKLNRATRELLSKWEILRQSWRDENSINFEKQYIDLVRSEVGKSAMAMERMDSMIQRIRHECK